MSRFDHFSPEVFRFLRQLQRNNERPWFKANQDRYESAIREPARAFVREMAPRIKRVSKHLVADDRKVGGSLMRPQRDTRFARDKSPYKTNVGIQFRHADGKDVHAPGLYVHFDPKEVFVAAGMWHPDSDALKKIRARIVDRPRVWTAARDGKEFRRFFELAGDSLKRPPRGFDPDHPLLADLMRTDHIAVCRLDRKQVTSRGFVGIVAERFLAARRYMRFLAEAVGMPF